jgi:hypothetical protein
MQHQKPHLVVATNINWGSLSGADATSAAKRTVPSPSTPMAVARVLLEESYSTPDGPCLRHHRGLPYLWDGIDWKKLNRKRTPAPKGSKG